MPPKRHRRNHNFQIEHFMAGGCYTPDAAYAELMNLLEERQMAVTAHNVATIKNEGRLCALRWKRFSPFKAHRLSAKADILEIKRGQAVADILYKDCLQEIRFIQSCIDRISPLRKYKELPDSDATEACMQEEWKHHLIAEAENHMIAQASIPASHFAAMRLHPEFESVIAPHVQYLYQLSKSGQKIALTKPLLLPDNG